MGWGSAHWRAAWHHCSSKRKSDKSYDTEHSIRVCNYCPAEFALPEFKYNKKEFQNEYRQMSVEERQRHYKMHEDEETKAIEENILPHLVNDHGFCVCPNCNSLIKKTGLSSHKKSFSCKESNRQNVMHGHGMIEVTGYAKVFLDDMTSLANYMKKYVEWDDYETRDFIEDELIKARREFARVGGLARVETTYINGEGWKECLWAPQSVAFFMKALVKRYPDALTQGRIRLAEMWQFLEADDFQRECAVGLMDIALDEM